MKIVVLLSPGRHPVSRAVALPRLEAQAIRLAAGIGGTVLGLHAGSDAGAVREALGQGLATIEDIELPEGADPAPALAARLSTLRPDLVLAGRRGQGGDESGIVPYALAEALGLPLIPDVVAVTPGSDAGTLCLDRSLGCGALLRVTVRGPVVVTVHPDAPAPLAYAHGQARRGTLQAIGSAAVPQETVPATVEERPYRQRPKLMKGASRGGSAAERLKAATGAARSAGEGRLLVDPDPETAAREILAHLRAIGVLSPPIAGGPRSD